MSDELMGRWKQIVLHGLSGQGLSETGFDDLIERWKQMERDCLAGTVDMHGAELAYNSYTTIESLQEKLKTAEKWDVIESQRNEELQARIAELEERIKSGDEYDKKKQKSYDLIQRVADKILNNNNRLNAALAQIEKDEVLPEPIRKFAGRARGGAVEIEKPALQANAWTMAVYIVEGGTLERDRSSCRATHDRLYCDSCGCYEDDKGYIDHLPDCVVWAARKVLEPGVKDDKD